MKNYKYMKSKVIINELGEFNKLSEKIALDSEIAINKRLFGIFAVIFILSSVFYLK